MAYHEVFPQLTASGFERPFEPVTAGLCEPIADSGLLMAES
jgi:hypothetical protein